MEWEHTFGFHPNDNLRLVVLQKNWCTSSGWCNTPSERCEGITKLAGFFTKPGGLQVYMAPGSSFMKKREYFCCWKALVAQLGLKTTCFVGHIFHISNFWSRKRGTVSVGKNEVFPEVWSVGFHQPWSCNIKVKAVRDMVGIGHTGMSTVLSNWVITPI